MIKLGINIDHVATLRQLRREVFPDPVGAAVICELAGCDSIVCHLREDRRHIQERDLKLLKEVVKTKLNLEMALSEDVIKIALETKPDQVTIVPEKREELTTEGGLDVITNFEKIKKVVETFHKSGIKVSLFIEPDLNQIEKVKETGANFIEIHTGKYSIVKTEDEIYNELNKIIKGTEFAVSIGLRVNAGHGLDYKNVTPICKINGIEELNIGYSIICMSVFTGLHKAVTKMIKTIRENERKD
ncbi:MAG TPA: pyridoxine 5'-phosphate synthase [Candidatus Ratteibacteria bacterium]|nr:pyridoxine 5'-phosphate synthase [Candidatus Ratteibacteria bacterium]